MRDYSDFLSDREMFILNNHPQMTYAKIGQKLGISPERVRQIKAHAERMIREEQRREQAKENARLPVQLTIQRRDVYIIIQSLRNYHHQLLRPYADQRIKNTGNSEDNPWIQRCEEIISLLQKGYSEEPFLSVISTYHLSEGRE